MRKGATKLNETMKDLSDKRKAVANDLNDLCDTLQVEIYIDAINRLQGQIKALESELKQQLVK